jgi:hypothetical protein
MKNEFSSIYFPFNFIVFLRYLDLNYRGAVYSQDRYFQYVYRYNFWTEWDIFMM